MAEARLLMTGRQVLALCGSAQSACQLSPAMESAQAIELRMNQKGKRRLRFEFN